MLNQECGVETNKQGPKVNLAERLIEHATCHLRPPEIEPGKHCKDHSAEEDIVEVSNDEI